MKGKNHVFMEATPGAAGGGAAGAAAAGAGAEAGAAAAAGATGASGAGAAGAGAGGADATPAGGAAAGGSAVAAGAAAAAGGEGAGAADAAGAATPWGFIPEKYQVKNDKGELDPAASAKKVADAHAALEKRMGEGSARPKTAADYKLPELPAELKDMPINEGLANAFRDKAHKAGFSQGQFEMAVGEFLQMAPTLVDAGMKFTEQDTVKALQESWGADYSKNAGAAWRATEQLATAAGVTMDEINTQLGNIPAFNKIMALVGMQLKEDTSVNTGGVSTSNGGMAEAAKIQQSEAYRNPRHPDHASATARWQAIVNGGNKAA